MARTLEVNSIYEARGRYKLIQEMLRLENIILESKSEFSQDYNPMHMDGDSTKSHGYARRVAHGVIQLSYISKVIGMVFPGKGAMWMNQTIDWLSPVFINDEIDVDRFSFSSSSNIFSCAFSESCLSSSSFLSKPRLTRVFLETPLLPASSSLSSSSVPYPPNTDHSGIAYLSDKKYPDSLIS